MSDLSLGIIEVIGLVGVIEVADVCLKSANVILVGYEYTNGDGMAVVKIEGSVGDVKAAIEASIVSVNKVSKVVHSKIIPRPSIEIDFLVRNKDTVGSENYSENTKVNKEQEIIEEIEEIKEIKEIKEIEIVNDNINEDNGKIYTCNLCKDPKCNRRKGELRSVCIHNKINKKNKP